MPGPSSTPTQLKILKGVHPYRINKNEPKPRAVVGTIPRGWATWMSDGAKRFWKKYAVILSELGVLTETDLPALRILAELWTKWVRCTNTINRGKMKAETELQYLRIADKLESQMLRYLQHFGMTASSRGTISISGASDEGEDDYLD